MLEASVTTEAIVIDPAGTILYRGRIDDRYKMIGKKRAVPQREDLRLALRAIADGRTIDVSTTQAIGCGIAYEKCSVENVVTRAADYHSPTSSAMSSPSVADTVRRQ